MIEEISIGSWKDITDWLEENVTTHQDVTSTLIQFRGQPHASWKLWPSLTRIIIGDDNSMSKADGYEKHAIADFVEQVHLLDSKMTYDLEADPYSMLFDMQHYSCPTRLLDWSRSPYVALYFAVKDSLDSYGALFVWKWQVYNSNYERLYSTKPLVNGADIFTFTEHDVIQPVFSTRSNERLARQQGSFSISNNILKAHDDLIIDLANKVRNKSGLYKLLIPSNLKLDFLERLRVMNITPLSLFPGLDGLGRTIKELLLIRQSKKM